MIRTFREICHYCLLLLLLSCSSSNEPPTYTIWGKILNEVDSSFVEGIEVKLNSFDNLECNFIDTTNQFGTYQILAHADEINFTDSPEGITVSFEISAHDSTYAYQILLSPDMVACPESNLKTKDEYHISIPDFFL